MQQMWSELIVMGMLLICSAEDIRRKQICLQVVLAFGILGVVFHMLWQNLSLENLLLGMAVGLGLLLFSLLTGGKIGAGDGAVVMVTGIFFGFERNLALLFCGLSISAMWALCLLLIFGFVQKKSWRHTHSYTIPFVPFLFLADLLLLAGAR